ncbi:WD domain, G-beta repeat-containing protein, partial [Toxoplasma gondii RUB]
MAARGSGRPRGGSRGRRKEEAGQKRKRLIPRKRQTAETEPALRKRAKKDEDEEISSDDADGPSFSGDEELASVDGDDNGESAQDAEVEGEFADERRLRIAQQFLSQLAARTGKRRKDDEQEEDDEEQDEEEDEEEDAEMDRLLRKAAPTRVIRHGLRADRLLAVSLACASGVSARPQAAADMRRRAGGRRRVGGDSGASFLWGRAFRVSPRPSCLHRRQGLLRDSLGPARREKNHFRGRAKRRACRRSLPPSPRRLCGARRTLLLLRRRRRTRANLGCPHQHKKVRKTL